MADTGSTDPIARASWGEVDWEVLLTEIRHGDCTPFLGAGACAQVLPLGRDIALSWSQEFDYPFADRDNLLRVSQYVSVQHNSKFIKRKLSDLLAARGSPDFTNPDEPHLVLAELPLSLYITTNYDDFMTRALARAVPQRQARREVCKWNLAGQRGSLTFKPPLTPTKDKPVVFHLHGSTEDVESMVLTEDDYLEFLMYVSEERVLLPPPIEQAFIKSCLLFMGYSLEDMNFKVLLRKLATYRRSVEGPRHVAVQLVQPAEESEPGHRERWRRQLEYALRQFELLRIRVYWGTCSEFAAELRRRWRDSNGKH